MRGALQPPCDLCPGDIVPLLVGGRVEDAGVGLEELRDLVFDGAGIAERGFDPGARRRAADHLQVVAEHRSTAPAEVSRRRAS
jgi:hypothetical protein